LKRLLVTGASGLLGLNLSLQACQRITVAGITHTHALSGAPFEVIPADLGQAGEFERVVEQFHPDAVIHAAALANVDACEKDPAQSARLNAALPGEVAAVCGYHDIRLVHISTDCVFDGVRGNYSEADRPNPQGVYAQDKLAGEIAVQAANARAAIARVNFYGCSLTGKRSLGEFFVNNLSAGKRVNGFTNVLVCTLFVNDLADLLLEMLEKDLSGVYHVLSREHQSKYAFGVMVARRFGLDESLINPISVEDAGLTAKRSPNLTLRTDKLAAALGHLLPGQAEGVEHFYQQYREGYPEKVRALAGMAARL
jgi:dTDP-4-dehydrorhamnose reductase